MSPSQRRWPRCSRAVKEKFGRLDVLFNNAGGNVPTTNFGDLTFEQWTHVVAVNLNGMFLCANAAFRMMQRPVAEGRADHQQRLDLGACAAPGSAAYTSTKHAVTGLTKSISLDGRHSTSSAARSTSATPRRR